MKSALVPPMLDLSVDRYNAWKAWKEKWDDYSELTGLKTKPDKYICAMIRYIFSNDTHNIYDRMASICLRKMQRNLRK